MPRKKTYHMRCINFGDENDIARQYIEQFVQTHSKNKLSKHIRLIIREHLETRCPSNIQNAVFIKAIQENKKIIGELNQEISTLKEWLQKNGYDVTRI